MKISFIVTYYNQEQFVSKSLDSILNITMPTDWEILVGDDGSDDNTVSIVKKYIDKYPNNIKLFKMPREKNKSYYSVKRASENRINLISHCTGDFFCTLDGDDFYLDKNFVLDAISIFEKNLDISIVMFGYCYYVNNAIKSPFLLPYDECKIDKKKYIEGLYSPAGACVHRVLWGKDRIEYIKKIGFFDDNNIVMNGLNFGELFYISRPIYAYRQTINSVYSSMNFTEKAVLNVLGYDTDKLFISNNYDINLLKRYSNSIFYVFCFRKRIRVLLGEKKYFLYSKNSCKIENSVLSCLLNCLPNSSNDLIFIKNKLKYLSGSNLSFFFKLTKMRLIFFIKSIFRKYRNE